MSIDEHVEKVLVVKVEPGDVVVLKPKTRVSASIAKDIRAQAAKIWPDNEIAVLSDMDIEVIRDDS
jgi:regulator of RNase E activity RraA